MQYSLHKKFNAYISLSFFTSKEMKKVKGLHIFKNKCIGWMSDFVRVSIVYPIKTITTNVAFVANENKNSGKKFE